MHISYFYNKLHFLRNTTKFGSQDLDLYNSTYHFSKFATKLKTNELAFSIESLTAGALGSVDPTRQLRQYRARRGTTGIRRRRPSPATAPTQP